MKYLYNVRTDFTCTCRQNTKTLERNDESIYDIAKLRISECKASDALVDSNSAINTHKILKEKKTRLS